MPGFHLIQDLAVILVVAGVAGWICQRAGLSVVVGFLVAGMLIGPHTPPFALVTEVERVETLAQLGLVFLMFSIGLQLSLRKLRRLGVGLLVATFAGALGVYQLSRLAALALGWNATEGLFLAGMLMVSSSAIISKILRETGTNHERAGQLAMGVSVLEDVVAVVMLTVLNSLVHFGRSGGAGVSRTLLLLGAFVALAGIVGLLLVPWFLRRLSVAAEEELQTLMTGGLMLGLAVIAQAAGYSLALGAFLLGTIVAETPHRHQVERTFAGMRDVFSAVFFVAIGMQIDVRLLLIETPLIAGISLLVLVARPLSVSAALLLVGTPLKDALRTGLSVTPIGEFSFIIAQLGVTAAVVPARFYPLAVGVSLVTTLAAPWLMRRAEVLAAVAEARQPGWLAGWIRLYQSWLEAMARRREGNVVWRLSRPRLVQIGLGALFVTGLVVFSGQLFAVVEQWLAGAAVPAAGLQLGFWTVLTLVILAPLVAIWRNVSAVAMLYAEISTRGQDNADRLRPLVEAGLKLAAAAAIYAWLSAILPAESTARWLLAVSGAVAVLAGVLLRRKLILWHNELEVELAAAIERGDSRMTSTTAPWLQPHGEWSLQMIDCTLPDLAACRGRSIASLSLRSRQGCSVVGIERQGFMIPLPPPETALFPRDKVLLLGTAEQVRGGKEVLSAVSPGDDEASELAEVRMEAMDVPRGSPAAGRRLSEITPAQRHGVQVAGLQRPGSRILNPSGQEEVRAGDTLLALGSPEQIRAFRGWLWEDVDAGEDSPEGIKGGGSISAS
jgi:CPA2 family monovalent cation:H+ antiporter-2